MLEFEEWVKKVNKGGKPTLITDNPAFDFAYINYYMHCFTGNNIFGWSARRIGDLYCGMVKDASAKWKFLRETKHTHHPVDDAKGNAEVILKMRDMGIKYKISMNYFEVDALSYSSLRALSIGPAYYKSQQEKESEEKEHFIIGSAVDCLLTEPDKFWEFYTLDFNEGCDKIQSGQMLKFIDYITMNEDCGKISGDCYQEAYEYAGFKQKKLETVIKEYKEDYKEYNQWLINRHNFYKENKDKTILRLEQYNLIQSITESLRNNEFTRKYFENSTGKNIEVFNQLEIYWELKGLKCKSKLDKVIIDNDDKTISIIDLKTTGNSTFSFDSSVFKWRYDIQACFYSMALYWLINESNDKYWNSLQSYKFEPFRFIVESTKIQGFPLVYKCSEKFLDNALDGYYKDKKHYIGIAQLIEDYKWYKETNNWTYNREIIENHGEVELSYE